MPESSLSIAEFFIRKAGEEGVPLRPMKLLKLVYLAHGWHLGLTGQPLISDTVEAWQYGPVIPVLYHQVKLFRNQPIAAAAVNFPKCPETLRVFLDSVWSAYKGYTDGQLSTLTHEARSPWDIAWNDMNGCNCRGTQIPEETMREFYRGKAEDARRQQQP